VTDDPIDDARSPKRLSEEALSSLEGALRELRQAMASGDFFEAERILRRPALDASVISDLISEVRRIRVLVRDAAPYFDRMEAVARGVRDERRIRQLQVRLGAEAKGNGPSRA
jgi:hypothetical protein